jgi:hypothetical protein
MTESCPGCEDRRGENEELVSQLLAAHRENGRLRTQLATAIAAAESAARAGRALAGHARTYATALLLEREG